MEDQRLVRIVECLGYELADENPYATFGFLTDVGEVLVIEAEPSLLLDMIPSIAATRPALDQGVSATAVPIFSSFDVHQFRLHSDQARGGVALSLQLASDGWLHFDLSRETAKSLHAALGRMFG